LKILSLLIALFVSHHWPRAVRWRRYGWLLASARRLAGIEPRWFAGTVLIAIALLLGLAAAALAESVAGLFGLLIVGTVAVLYTLGPHHLDRDINWACDDVDSERRQVARERLLLDDGVTASKAAASALHAALARWFGVIFWFVLLGPAGCLVYRAVREGHHSERFQPPERAWMGRALAWLNWPVVALMTAGIALMTDFDRVRSVFEARDDRWDMPAALLDDLAAALCESGGGIPEGLGDGRRLAWRTLGLWLAVLSLLLLAGLLS
jgi:AmpE protein